MGHEHVSHLSRIIGGGKVHMHAISTGKSAVSSKSRRLGKLACLICGRPTKGGQFCKYHEGGYVHIRRHIVAGHMRKIR